MVGSSNTAPLGSVLRGLVLLGLTATTVVSATAIDILQDQKHFASPSDSSDKFHVEVFIMSKCPDAKDCVEQLIHPAFEKIDYDSNVKLDFEYIGSPEPQGGVSCKHGPSECLGNIIHQCARLTHDDPAALLFQTCLLHDYWLTPQREHVSSCANKTGVDFEKLNECGSDPAAVERLRESFEVGRKDGVNRSCTVRVQGEIVCIRDDGRWIVDEGCSVDDFVKRIKKRIGKRDKVRRQDDKLNENQNEQQTEGELQSGWFFYYGFQWPGLRGICKHLGLLVLFLLFPWAFVSVAVAVGLLYSFVGLLSLLHTLFLFLIR